MNDVEKLIVDALRRALDLLQNNNADRRPFVLRRHRDPTGVSGTGDVARGIDLGGVAVMRWDAAGQPPTITVYPDIDAIEAINGHGGSSRVVYDHNQKP